jgi:HD-GYP domain-containing protein (c-di-GMP phosphodiesterase class II)
MKIRIPVKIAFKSIICFLIIFTPATVLLSADDDTVEYIYQEGLNKYALSDYRSAINDFAKVHALQQRYKNNNTMLYRSLVRLGDIEYKQHNLTDARKLYAQAIGIAGENDGLLWRLKTIDDINDRVRDEKKKSDSVIARISLIGFASAAFLIIVFTAVIILLLYRRKKEHPFANLIHSMPQIDESGNIDKEYYDNIVRTNHLKDILCAITTNTLSADLLKKYESDLSEEIKLNVIEYLEKKESGDAEVSKSWTPNKLLTYSAEESFPENIKGSGINTDLSGSFFLLASIIDSKTGRNQHSLRVAEHAYSIACLLAGKDIHPLMVKNAALVHDIGFIGLKGRSNVKETANPPEQNNEYMEMVKLHTSRGSRLIHIYGMSNDFDECILHHHERYDGSGYPNGLKGEQIPLIALIISAAEHFEGLNEDNVSAMLSKKETEALFGKRVGAALFDLIIQSQENRA